MNTAIFFADGFEEIEGLTVVDMFRRAGISIQTVSISDSLTVTGSHDIKVQADCLLKDFDFNTVEMLILRAVCRVQLTSANANPFVMH